LIMDMKRSYTCSHDGEMKEDPINSDVVPISISVAESLGI